MLGDESSCAQAGDGLRGLALAVAPLYGARMNRGTIWVALIAAITVTCAVTVPAKAVHTSAINEKAMAAARQSGVAGAIGAGIMGGLSETMIGGLLEYKSYVVFSTMTNPKGSTISVGALGQVFVVVDLDDHRKK